MEEVYLVYVMKEPMFTGINLPFLFSTYLNFYRIRINVLLSHIVQIQ
jgi:hypothetical protein